LDGIYHPLDIDYILQLSGKVGNIMKEGQKSIRIIMADDLYEALKLECQEHGDVSRLIRRLIKKHLESLGRLTIYEDGIVIK